MNIVDYLKRNNKSVIVLKEPMGDLIIEHEEVSAVFNTIGVSIGLVLLIIGFDGDFKSLKRIGALITGLSASGLTYTLYQLKEENREVEKFLNTYRLSSLDNITIVSNIHPDILEGKLKELGIEVKIIDKTQEFRDNIKKKVLENFVA
jgi:hypothetical protein